MLIRGSVRFSELREVIGSIPHVDSKPGPSSVSSVASGRKLNDFCDFFKMSSEGEKYLMAHKRAGGQEGCVILVFYKT